MTAIIDQFYLIFIITVNARSDAIEKISLHYIRVLHSNKISQLATHVRPIDTFTGSGEAGNNTQMTSMDSLH